MRNPWAVATDRRGRTIVLDGSSRTVIFGADGSPETTWPVPDFYPASRLAVDTLNNVYPQIRIRIEDEEPQLGTGAELRLAFVRYSPDGVPGDTMPPRGWTLDRLGTRVVVSDGPRTCDNFAPLGLAIVHRFGGLLTGETDRYM